jgi:hypothetical protein
MQDISLKNHARGDLKDAAVLMNPADEDVLQTWPRRVNSSRADDADGTLIDKIESPA